MTKYIRLALIAALAPALLLAALTTPALADHDRYWQDSNGVWRDSYDDNNDGRWPGYNQGYDGDENRDWRDRGDNDRWNNDRWDNGRDDRRVSISDRDRTYLARVLRANFFRDCPRTKRNVCMMPRFQRQQYEIGKRLPRGVDYSVPSSLRVSPPPGDYQYIKLGDDVLLIHKKTKKVYDAVTLRSALQNY